MFGHGLIMSPRLASSLKSPASASPTLSLLHIQFRCSFPLLQFAGTQLSLPLCPAMGLHFLPSLCKDVRVSVVLDYSHTRNPAPPRVCWGSTFELCPGFLPFPADTQPLALIALSVLLLLLSVQLSAAASPALYSPSSGASHVNSLLTSDFRLHTVSHAHADSSCLSRLPVASRPGTQQAQHTRHCTTWCLPHGLQSRLS